MICTHNDLLTDIACERRDTLLREAQQQRTLCELAVGAPGPWEQLRIRIGDTLIGAGTHLKERTSRSDSLAHSTQPSRFAYDSHHPTQK